MKDLKGRSLVSITDYNREEIIHILDMAEDFEKNQRQQILGGHVIASLFFEPSTRTRLSFESAVQYLGGSIIGFASADTTSVRKGESLKDTILTVSNYSDLIV
jgi:Aspartate carbamoyltransferase, catalytic chain